MAIFFEAETMSQCRIGVRAGKIGGRCYEENKAVRAYVLVSSIELVESSRGVVA